MHKREKPSPRSLINIKKSAVQWGEDICKKIDEMSWNFREIIKKLHFLVSRKPARGLPTPSPHLFHVLDGKCGSRVRLLLARITSGRGRAGWFAKRCHSITDYRIYCKFKTKIANGILLLCYLDKICWSRPPQHKWSSKALFFPTEITAAHSLHFQHPMWTRGY